MRKEVIKIIKKTARTNIKYDKGGKNYRSSLENPEEIADAVIKVIFGKDMAEMISGSLTFDEMKKQFEKRNPGKSITRIYE